MPISYNMSPGGLHYSPERDFAYNYPRLISCVIRAFNTEYWPLLLETLQRSFQARDSTANDQAFWENVCLAKDRYCNFIDSCCQDPSETVDDVLRRCGWYDLPVQAQIAWMAMLGTVMTGQLFQGIRDITTQGEKSQVVINLMQSARNAALAWNTQQGAEITHSYPEQLHNLVTAMRESGMSQQDIRDSVAVIFNHEENLV